jgi:hypothetical protein
MLEVRVGLSGAAAKKQARYLARAREEMVRRQAKAELARLRELIRAAHGRRKEAHQRAVALCRRARLGVRERVKAYRAAESERINRHVAELRQAAREQCAARKARIRAAGHSVAEQARRRLREDQRLGNQLRRLEAQAARKRAGLTTAKERRQESDGEVESNLPPELQTVWRKVRRTIKAGPRTTRTEAFVEWAESHPEEVAALQYGDVDREVAALVREREHQEAQSHARTAPRERGALVRIGLAKTQAAAKKVARAAGLEDVVPF